MNDQGLELLRESLAQTILAGISGIEHVYATPRDELERRLARIWAEVLERDHVAPPDDFFQLGGHSLLAVQLIGRIEEEFGEAPPLATVFEASTLSAFAAHMRGNGRPQPVTHDDRASLVTLNRGAPGHTPLFLAADFQGEIPAWYRLLATHMPAELPLYAVRSQGLAGQLPAHDRMEQMVEAYLVLLRQVQPTGPYMVAGHCFSGNVAFEMARQLRAAGDEVSLLAIIDSSPYGHGRRLSALTDVMAHVRALRSGSVDRGEYVLERLRRFGRRSTRFVGRYAGSEKLVDLGRAPVLDGPPVAAGNMRAARHYTCPPYPGRIVAVTVNPGRTGARTWARVAQGGAEQHVMRGKGLDHVSVLREPHVRDLAAILAESVRAASPPPRETPPPAGRRPVLAYAL